MMRIQRYLFDFFKGRDGRVPRVFDGDDVVWQPTKVARAVGSALGISPEGFCETWEPKPDDQRSRDGLIKHFLQTIDDSTGIERLVDLPRPPTLDQSHATWSQAYGQIIADQLKATVEDSIPHYNYMRKFCVQRMGASTLRGNDLHEQ